MRSIVRSLLALALILGIAAPAALAVCLPADARHCTPSQSSHDCCEGPRLSQCDCQGSHGAGVPAEPAGRNVASSATAMVASLSVQPGIVLATDRSFTHVDSSPPAIAGGDRLSLFSILLV